MNPTDCKLSLGSLTGKTVIFCEFNTPRKKAYILNLIGNYITLFGKVYKIKAAELYAVADDRDIYGTTFLVDECKGFREV